MYYFYKKYNVSVGGAFLRPPAAPGGPYPMCLFRVVSRGGEICLTDLIK